MAAISGSLAATAVALALIGACAHAISEDRNNRQEIRSEVLRVCEQSEDVADCVKDAQDVLDG